MSRVGRKPDSGVGQQLVLQFSNERFNHETFLSQRTCSRGDGRARSHSLHRPGHVNQVISDRLGMIYQFRNQPETADSICRAIYPSSWLRCHDRSPQR
jgi:hypothetical protein